MKFMHVLVRILLTIIIATIAGIIILNLVTTPSNDRAWKDNQAILPYVDFNNETVTVHNIRNFSYGSTTIPAYYDAAFDLRDIKRVWFIVSPFSGVPGSAHTFLSFEFAGDRFLAISVEARKEQDEDYSPLKGLFNGFELMYVVADERDAIKLRTNEWKDRVFVYPIRATQDQARSLFVSMLASANDLREHPQFYNTITNSCTSNIASHVNMIAPHRVPLYSRSIIFPANSDKLAYDLGLLDTDLSFEEARKRYNVNDKALMYADDPAFSTRIREE
jgi:hypothetical protein